MLVIFLFCIASLTLFAFALVTYFIISMVQLVGLGEGFWSVWIVQLDLFLAILTIGFWIGAIRLANKKEKLKSLT